MGRLSLTSSSSSSLLATPLRNPRDLPVPSTSPLRLRPSLRAPRRLLVSALSRRPSDGPLPKAVERISKQMFASVSSSSGTETSSIGTSQFPVSPPQSSVGSPLFWIGVGVALSALFSWVANFLKKYAMQQAFKSMMGQMPPQKGPFGNSGAFPGQPSPFPIAPAMPPPSPPSTSPSPPSPSQPAMSQPDVTVDVSATKVESASPVSTTMKEDLDITTESKKYAFVDVSPEVSEAGSSEGFKYSKEDSSTNGSPVKQETKTDEGDATDGSQSWKTPRLSVDALEKMMEDPIVQKMVFPYLPEEMRNPATFKWMLQNPQYRQQLQEMLDSMSGNKEWDKQVMASLKKFDLNSPEVKQQFEQIGLTPEEVISKIMENPDIAMSFQNPKVQAAIMDCSENPLNIQKYQDDKEVMDVFKKISKLFPGVPGF